MKRIISCHCFDDNKNRGTRNDVILHQYDDEGYPVVYEKWQQNNNYNLGGYRSKKIKFCPDCGKEIRVSND